MIIKCALIVVDVQYDFLKDGALPVPEGEAVVPIINDIISKHKWTTVCATQDYHPADHVSFASNHPGKVDFDEIEIQFRGMKQVQRLWPIHCVQNTRGSELHVDLQLGHSTRVFRKGYNKDLDSYSGFSDSFGHESTGLDEHLQTFSIDRVFIVGLAEDYCVYQTALSAGALHYEVYIIRDGVRGLRSLSDQQKKELDRVGVKYLTVNSRLMPERRDQAK